MTFLEQVRQTIARYSMLRQGDRLGIAVSGGADSLCLLYVVLELRAELDLELSVIHVDHNLRGPESQADAQFVHKIAQQRGLPFHSRTLDLLGRRGNLEQEARRERYGFFRDLTREGIVQKVALGHTRSDQAETVLFRLLRGAGSAGLAGIRPVTDLGIVRPLLQVTRLQVEGWLEERGLVWREDASNRELRFDRNRLRHRLIPQLQAEWNPGLTETLARTADWAFEEERYWLSEIPRLTTDWVRFAKEAIVLDVRSLNALPLAAVRRIIREFVRQVKGDLLGVDFANIEAICHLAALPSGSSRLRLFGLEIVRSFDWVRFAKEANPVKNWEIEVAVPGTYVVSCRTDGSFMSPLNSTTIELQSLLTSGVYNKDVSALDLERAGERLGAQTCGPLVLRNWRPGDCYQRQGHAGPVKLKKLFQQNRIPLWERQNWPILTVGCSIAWVGRFGPAAQFAADADSRTVLRIQESHESWDMA